MTRYDQDDEHQGLRTQMPDIVIIDVGQSAQTFCSKDGVSKNDQHRTTNTTHQ
jgi:hypothetical protein